MEVLLAGITGTCVLLDDVVVSGKTLQEHNVALRAVLTRIREAGLRLNREKCVFGAHRVVYGSPVKVSLVLLFRLYLVLFQVKVHKYRPKITVCSFSMNL